MTRRTKQLVWDDEVDMAEMDPPEVVTAPTTASPRPSINTMPLPRRTRSQSASADFPPPIRRTSTEAARPVPFSAKFQKVHESVTGVTVLEHLERLDAVEASLKRLGRGDDSIIEEEYEEVDVGESSQTKPIVISQNAAGSSLAELTPPGSPSLPTVPEDMALENSVTEEDLAMLSKSVSYAEGSSRGHTRWPNIHGRQQEGARNLDWMHAPELDEGQSHTMIVEVRFPF